MTRSSEDFRHGLRYMIECIYTRTYFDGPLLEPNALSLATSDNQFVVHIEILRLAQLCKVHILDDKSLLVLDEQREASWSIDTAQ